MNKKKNIFHMKIFIFKTWIFLFEMSEKANPFFCSYKPVREREEEGGVQPEKGDDDFCEVPTCRSPDHF